MYGRNGSLNPNYNNIKEKVGYTALHHYVRRNKPTPSNNLCELCDANTWQHLANVTGIYDRNFENWSYLCAKCHFQIDSHLHPRAGHLFTKRS